MLLDFASVIPLQYSFCTRNRTACLCERERKKVENWRAGKKKHQQQQQQQQPKSERAIEWEEKSTYIKLQPKINPRTKISCAPCISFSHYGLVHRIFSVLQSLVLVTCCYFFCFFVLFLSHSRLSLNEVNFTKLKRKKKHIVQRAAHRAKAKRNEKGKKKRTSNSS